jgi:hypothetical protein
MTTPPNARNLLVFVLFATGSLLLGLAFIDWASYSSFTFSMIWG